MPDIRSFFQRPGGTTTPKKAEDKSDKKSEAGAESATRRTRGRKVVDDDTDDDVVEIKKTPAKASTRKTKKEPEVEISASEYFSSNATKPKVKKPLDPSMEVPVRLSPMKKENIPQVKAPAVTKRITRALPKHTPTPDEDAFEDDSGDDIFRADYGRKGDEDEYMEIDSDGEDIKPKARAKPVASKSKKRKSPVAESESEVEGPKKKKPASAKPRAAPKAKTHTDEAPEIQNILDTIPTVRPPTPPPKDPSAKFDWRKAKGGGNAAAPPPLAGTVELPEGEDECLAGLTFVFTGLLQTISRDDAQALVKKFGGKVTGQPSTKTSYVVLGEEAGPSKLAKIKAHGIKTINEEGLFELIRKLPAYGGTGKGAEKAREKKDLERKKAEQEAKAMEAEEKRRKAEAEAAAKKAAAARGTAAPAVPAKAPVDPSAQLWTTKYAPTQMIHICGNKGNVEKIQSWLHNWPKHKKYDFQRRGADGMGGARAIIISGPPGIGKTTSAHLAAQLEGYDVIESNASDTRSKRMVEDGLSDVMNNTSLLGYFAGDGKDVDNKRKKLVLIMDEVDGMSAGDRGGVGALAKFCKKTEVPLILICNDRRLPKMKPFDLVAFNIPFQRPTVDQIRSRIMSICFREGIKIPVIALDAIIEGSNRDIRQIINMVAAAKLDQSTMDLNKGKQMSKSWEKHIILKPWDICSRILAGGLFLPSSNATLNDKIELYFNDHEFSYLMIQENYLRCRPMEVNRTGFNNPREARLKALELFDQAAESISDGDLVDRMIHGPQQQWSLMPTHAVFSTVRPASYVYGSLGQPAFTSWLGANSKAGKLSRYVREIHSHMRLKSSGDHNEIRQQYLPVLWNQTVKSLFAEGKDAVPRVIDLMDSYYLTRDDFDSMMELGVGPQDESLVKIETQTKTHFTRTYNNMKHPMPFMKAATTGLPTKKLAKDVPDLEEAIEEDDDDGQADPEPDAEEKEDMDLKNDKYIKKPKAKKAPAKKAPAKKATAAPKKKK
ncbi:Replication factor C subunit 1 [Ceratocystis lukuohia]|uniref:Replication factor C subunit 1 n=1 Tax=Ceratocystis lukuohia TaxID=2019550 RepID=A0ABR4MSQ8_9PEZI